jgi:hypothetical protein
LGLSLKSDFEQPGEEEASGEYHPEQLEEAVNESGCYGTMRKAKVQKISYWRCCARND